MDLPHSESQDAKDSCPYDSNHHFQNHQFLHVDEQGLSTHLPLTGHRPRNGHFRGDSTASAASVGAAIQPFHHSHVKEESHGHGARHSTMTAGQRPSVRGHKRTKSAGNYTSAKDLSIYMTTGLYAHHPIPSFRSIEYGFNSLSQRGLTSESHLPTFDKGHSKQPLHPDKSSTDSSEEETSAVVEIQGDCGILSFRPQSLQKFATIQVFVLLACLLVTLNQALSSGYFNSVITTIEKRFDIPSRMTGLIASTFEIGNLITVIFVSYFGTHRHIPKWIGRGVVVTGLGSIVFSLAHFVARDNPLDMVNISGPLDDNICHIPSPSLNSPFVERASSGFISPSIADPSTCKDSGTYRSPHLIIFVLAMILIGCGGTPIFTLGTIYIDDHVKQESSSMYIGCMYSMVAFGVLVGFLLGGYFITIHENSFGTGVIPSDLYPGHPKWIGAWWCGFILLGLLLILIAIPFFSFPQSLKKRSRIAPKIVSISGSNIKSFDVNRDKSKSYDAEGTEYGRSLKEIPKCMWRLLSNPVYIVTCLGSCMELSIVNGFLVFLPKYLETQFTIGKSEANLFAGGIAVPGACIGIFLGGYLLKRFQLGIKGAIQFVLFFNLVCMGLYTGLYFLGCDNMRIAGATLPYSNSSSLEVNTSFQVNLTADCNQLCGCSPNDIEPVCGRNGLTYFSPCHAGCRVAGGPRHIQNYSNCACITDTLNAFEVNNGVSAIPIATAGPCPQMCHAMIPFLVILFIVTLVVSITQMPLLMITLRSVREDERAFALGLQFVIFRIFGYIPSPIVFGTVVDSTCVYWKANCGRQGGSCLIYDIEKFRLRYIGVCSSLKVAAALLFFLDWLLVCYSSHKNYLEPLSIDVKQIASALSLDRISSHLPESHSSALVGEDQVELLEPAPDSDYNSAADVDVDGTVDTESAESIRHRRTSLLHPC